MTAFIAVLIMLMIVGALIATFSTRLLHSIVSLGAVGFLLSIIFVFLGAPDLAITQIAVEVITLVLLLRTVQGRDSKRETPRAAQGNRWFAVIAILLLAIGSFQLFAGSSEFGTPIMVRMEDSPSQHYLENGIDETGSANIVTAILLDYRGYDTLGEATVLFCAVVGAITILQIRSRKRSPSDGIEEEAS